MTPEKKENRGDAERAKRNRLRAAIVALLAIIVILLLLLLRQCGREEERRLRDPNASIGQLEGKTREEIQAELDRVVAEGMFNISISPAILFENSSAQGNLQIENVPGNPYLMSVQITLDDTGEVVYTSGLLEPNQHIQSAALDVALPKGDYPATATFTAYNLETEEGQAAAKIRLVIQN